jgi:hypothetical protein
MSTHRGRDINDELAEVEVTQALARTDRKFGIIMIQMTT